MTNCSDDLQTQYPDLRDNDRVCNCVDCGVLLLASRHTTSRGLPMPVYEWIGVRGGRTAPICKPCMIRRCDLAAQRLKQSRMLEDSL